MKKNKLQKGFECFFGLVGVAMILISSYAVLARDVLQISAPWTDEAVKLLNVWMIFVVSALAFDSNDQISLTLIEDSRSVRKKPVAYRSMKLVQYVVTLVLNCMLIQQLMQIIKTQVSTGEATTVMRYPLWLLNLGMLVGSVLTVIFAALKLVDTLKNFHVSPEQ